MITEAMVANVFDAATETIAIASSPASWLNIIRMALKSSTTACRITILFMLRLAAVDNQP